MKKVTSVLAVDRGTKYIGLAYANHKTQFIMPVGYLLNDKMVYFNIADIIQRHHVTTIVIGRPAKQKDIQEKISKFMQ
jgi:RNase H-fold protein (predicted Holliday junction resolvase)